MNINQLINLLQGLDATNTAITTTTPTLTNPPSDTPYEIGKSYYFRTSCYHSIGTVTKITPNELVLEPACWVADGGRYYNTQKEGISSLNEVEPCIGPQILGRAYICDAVEWKHAVPLTQK